MHPYAKVALTIGLFLVIGTLLQGVCLRLAILLYNHLAGSAGTTQAVPQPSFLWACAISLVTMLVSFAAGFFIGSFLARATATVPTRGFDISADRVAQGVTIGVSVLLTIAIL